MTASTSVPRSAPSAPSAPSDAEIDRLRLVLVRLARRIRTTYADEITPSQLAVMSTLGRFGPLTVGQIAEREHVQPPSASKIVAALEQGGYVTRTTDPTDRRCQPIDLTAVGRAYIDRARRAGRTFLAEQLDRIDGDDRAAITSALPALERLLGDIE